MKRISQFDSIRAFGLISVLLTHWLWRISSINCYIGQLGLNIFFILSGFLITGILFKCRQSKSKISALKNFYIRRFLRIFPLYYAVIILLLITGYISKEIFIWNFFYCNNIYAFLYGKWIPLVGHFWSLSVEEQFYLIWPFYILYIPQRYFLYSMIIIMIVSPVTRIILYSFNYPYGDIQIFPLCTLDFFGFGGLLAYYKEFHPQLTWPLKRLGQLALISLFSFIFICFFKASIFQDRMWDVLSASLMVFFLGWVVLKASYGFTGIVGKILDFGPVVYLGTISYGVYIVHMWVFIILHKILKMVGLSYDFDMLNAFVRLVLALLVVVSIASLSWFFYEKPIMQLKDRFPQVP